MLGFIICGLHNQGNLARTCVGLIGGGKGGARVVINRSWWRRGSSLWCNGIILVFACTQVFVLAKWCLHIQLPACSYSCVMMNVAKYFSKNAYQYSYMQTSFRITHNFAIWGAHCWECLGDHLHVVMATLTRIHCLCRATVNYLILYERYIAHEISYPMHRQTAIAI